MPGKAQREANWGQPALAALKREKGHAEQRQGDREFAEIAGQQAVVDVEEAIQIFHDQNP